MKSQFCMQYKLLIATRYYVEKFMSRLKPVYQDIKKNCLSQLTAKMTENGWSRQNH